MHEKQPNEVLYTAKTDTKSKVTNKVLITCLELLQTLIKNEASTFFESNAGKIKHLLYPCFQASTKGGEVNRVVSERSERALRKTSIRTTAKQYIIPLIADSLEFAQIREKGLRQVPPQDQDECLFAEFRFFQHAQGAD